MKSKFTQKLETITILGHENLHPIDFIWLVRQLKKAWEREIMLLAAVSFTKSSGAKAILEEHERMVEEE